MKSLYIAVFILILVTSLKAQQTGWQTPLTTGLNTGTTLSGDTNFVPMTNGVAYITTQTTNTVTLNSGIDGLDVRDRTNFNYASVNASVFYGALPAAQLTGTIPNGAASGTTHSSVTLSNLIFGGTVNAGGYGITNLTGANGAIINSSSGLGLSQAGGVFMVGYSGSARFPVSVKIGSTAPTASLDVTGNGIFSGTITATNGFNFPSNTLTFAAVEATITNGGGAIKMISNGLWSVTMSNNVSNWKLLNP